MASKIFISWSGDLSKSIAEEIRLWLPKVLQFTKPFFTPNDIEKGTQWLSKIKNELESSNVGIICLTRDNLNKPWILFEAGALSKNFDKANVCTILFNIDDSDINGPLKSFQSTKFNKSDFKKLLEIINNTGHDLKLEPSVLNEVFDYWWPLLETRINEIIKNHLKVSNVEKMSDRQILEENLFYTKLKTRELSNQNGVPTEKVAKLIRSFFEMLKIEGLHKERTCFMEDFRKTFVEIIKEHDSIDLKELFTQMYKDDNYDLKKMLL